MALNSRVPREDGYLVRGEGRDLVAVADWPSQPTLHVAGESLAPVSWSAMAVVAHICPDEAAVTSARAKGTSGFQCSGVGVIRPRR